MVDQTTNKMAPPYVSFVTFRNLLDRLHDVGVPEQIERDVFGTQLNGGVYGHLKSALKFLRLIDEKGKTTHALEALAESDVEKRKQLLADLLRSRYTFLFGSEAGDFDLSKTTTRILRKKFEEQGITAAVSKKSLSFFIQAAQYVGMPLSKHVYTPKQFVPRPRTVRAFDKPKSETSGESKVTPDQREIRPASTNGGLEDKIDDLMFEIAQQSASEKARLFEHAKKVIRYAEVFGRAQ